MTDLGSDPNDPSVFHVYEFKPDNTTFDPAATVDLPAPPLNPGESVVIEVNNGTGWMPIATTLNAGRVTGSISHFSSCRTRVIAPTQQTGLNFVDMVEFQDVVNILNPTGLVIPGCDPGSALYGVCFTVANNSAQPVSVVEVRVAAWQCYTRIGDFPPPGDPTSPSYEGEHCDITGLLIPCAPDDVRITLPVALQPGFQTTIQYDLHSQPGSAACFGSSFVGVDVLLREPTVADPAGGIRSAKDGPFIGLPNGTVTTFKGIFPTLKFTPAPQSKPIKNFLIDARE